ASCLAPVPMMRVALAALLACLLLLPMPADTRPTTAADYVRMLIERSREDNEGFPVFVVDRDAGATPIDADYSSQYSKRSAESNLRRAARSNSDQVLTNIGAGMFRFG
ncbi:hypothetical protein PFISCL1PPCAC_22507, partial [Pristionchus fissidentatus]